jgi:hypothetical protein
MRNRCLLVAAAVAAIAAAVVIQSTAHHVLADDSRGREHQITIIARPSALPAGTRCQVELIPETNNHKRVVVIYEGKVASATDEGIKLTVASGRRKEIYLSSVSRLPVVHRLFTNVGVTPAKPGEEKDVWIPAEKIRSVELARNSKL